MGCQKIIIDCDAGTDDALALAMLLAAHKQSKVEILAITCVFGNTDIDNVINNVFRTLQIYNAADIPVYKGANSALLPKDSNHGSHGTDGFGDVFTDKPDISRLIQEHAVNALHRITSVHYGDVSVLCLGPLTNIALTIKMYPGFAKSVKKFFIMGGTISESIITTRVDFNFYADPESVAILISNAPKKLWILPLDTCLKSKITYEWREKVFGKINTSAVEFLNAIEKKTYEAKKEIRPYYTPCDAFTAGILLRPDLARDIEMYHIGVELSEGKMRGKLIVDNIDWNAYLIHDIDSEILKDLLLLAANHSAEKTSLTTNC